MSNDYSPSKLHAGNRLFTQMTGTFQSSGRIDRIANRTGSLHAVRPTTNWNAAKMTTSPPLDRAKSREVAMRMRTTFKQDNRSHFADQGPGSSGVEHETVSQISNYFDQQLARARHDKLSFGGPQCLKPYSTCGKNNQMPRIGNTTHCAESNNGYARKPCGGFYNH